MQNKTYYCYFRSKEVSEECRTRHTIVTSDQKKCQRNAGQDILLLLQIKRSVRGMQNKTYYCYFRSKEVSEECRSRHTIVTSDQKKCQRNAGQDILLLLQIKRSVRGMQNKTYYCYFRSKEVSEECRTRHTIVTSDQVSRSVRGMQVKTYYCYFR